MKLFFVISVIFTVFAASKAEDSSSFILGGRNASIEDFPHMVGILTDGRFTCGGAVINSRSILTVHKNLFLIPSLINLKLLFIQAAHCYIADRVSSVSVFVGTSRQNGEGGRHYRILRFILHPEYKYVPEPFDLRADIAVIKTILPIRFNALTQPIPLGSRNVPSQARTVLSGWGFKAIVSF